MTTLFDPIKIGDISLSNRIVMAPLTRNRAIAGNCPGPMTVDYYRQRAAAGLIIAEASQISPMGQGYLDTPGIYSQEQVAAWRQVTDAVHKAGGKIVARGGGPCVVFGAAIPSYDLYTQWFRTCVSGSRAKRRGDSRAD
jgi:2,4-dienoyl-CoA reductase-like NADH-dependent reductase (Old Yellow Enzyme family)